MTAIHTLLLVVNTLLILGFGGSFLARANYEFMAYIGVIVISMIVIWLSLRRVRYTTATLVGLTVWSAMHLAGGGIPIGNGRLYDVMLIPLSTRLPILRYDQLVHIWGFGAATLVMYCLLDPASRARLRTSPGLMLLVVMAGLGVGAFNEIVEFIVTLIVPNTGVGGYENTALDLCANLIGALLALAYIRLRYHNEPTQIAASPP